MKLSSTLKRLLDCLGRAVFPAKCLGCGCLFHEENAGAASRDARTDIRSGGFSSPLALHFCPLCRERWTAIASPMCPRCGLAFKSREGEDHLCGRCLNAPDGFTRARAAGIYDNSLRTAVHALKFKGAVNLAPPLGRLLFDTFRLYWPAEKIDMVAPVPLHGRRFRQRGFNQSYLLIRKWTLPVGTVIVRDLLVRTRATPPQTGLDRRQRRTNIKKAFGLRRPGQSRGKRVLLVDDVLTTGATANACAAALIRDGARQVDVLTLARAL